MNIHQGRVLGNGEGGGSRDICILQIHSETYECLFFRQNGGDGFHQARDNLIPQPFHIRLWITQKKPLESIFWEKELV